MKKIILIFFLFVSLILKTQNTYYKAYDAGAPLGQDTKSIIKTLSGGLAMITYDSTLSMYKTDLGGNIIWKKQFHHSPNIFIPGLLTQDLVDSGFYLCTGNVNLTKVDKSGNLLWSKKIPSLIGSVFICGSIGGGFILTSGSNYDNYLLRFDSGGNIVWQYRYQTATNGGANLSDILQCKNGDYVISGSCTNNARDPQIFRVDSSGMLKWFNIYDLGPDNEVLNLSAKSNDETTLVCGSSYNPAYYQSLYFRIDSMGNIINFKKYHNAHNPSYSVILSFGPNRVLMAGNALYSGSKNLQNLYTYMDYTGTPIWNKTSGNSLYSSAGADYTECGVTVSPNSFVLGGYGEGKFITMIDSAGNGFCNSDTILLKDTTYGIPILTPTIATGATFYSTTNNIIIVNTPTVVLTSYCNMTLGINSGLNIAENIIIYPNPASSNSYFELKSDLVNENSEIIINDVLGRNVFRSKLQTGINKIPTPGWNNGVYFFTICDNKRILGQGKICVAD